MQIQNNLQKGNKIVYDPRKKKKTTCKILLTMIVSLTCVGIKTNIKSFSYLKEEEISIQQCLRNKTALHFCRNTCKMYCITKYLENMRSTVPVLNLKYRKISY